MGLRRTFSVLLISLALPSPPPAPARAEPLIGVTSSNLLVEFDSTTPASCATLPIVGLPELEGIIAIDFRPASPYGRLYGLGYGGQVYLINTTTGVATPVGSGGLPLTGVAYGMDFNPAVDRIRVVNDTDQNFRLNPDTGGLTAMDAALSYAPGDLHAGQSPNVTAAAYSNNYPGVSRTTLYVIDSAFDLLAIQDPPNGGVLHTVGPLGVNASADNGFDISGATRTAYAVFNINLPPVTPILYKINLTTGLASAVSAIGCGGTIRGLSVVTSLLTDVAAGPSPRLSLAAAPSVATTSTLLDFGAPLEGPARVGVYDVLGRLVRSFNVPVGQREQRWDLTDDRGGRLAFGLYVVHLRTAYGIATARIVIVG